MAARRPRADDRRHRHRLQGRTRFLFAGLRRNMAEGGSWLSRLRTGLAKSTKRVTAGITGLSTKKKLDQRTLDDLGEELVQPGVGLAAPAPPGGKRGAGGLVMEEP